MSILNADGREVSSKDKKKKVTVGLDLALRNCGWSVFHNESLIEGGCLTTKPFKKPKGKDGKKVKQEMYFNEWITHELQQTHALAIEIRKMCESFKPDLVVIETPTFSQSAPQTLGLAWSAVISILQVFNCKFVMPNAAKRITGNANRTTKFDIKRVVLQKYPQLHVGNQNEHFIDSIASVIYQRDFAANK